MIIGVRGVDRSPVSALAAQLATAGAVYRGTVWLTDRFQLDDSGELKDMAALLQLPEQTDPATLRSAGVLALAGALRPRTADATDDAGAAPAFLAGLRER